MSVARSVSPLLRLPDVSPEWRSLRRALLLARGGLVVFVLCLLTLGAAGIWLSSSPESVQEAIALPGYALAFAGMLAWIAGGVWRNLYRCPRCGRRFFMRSGRWVVHTNSWARRCLNCQLPRWAPVDESASAV